MITTEQRGTSGEDRGKGVGVLGGGWNSCAADRLTSVKTDQTEQTVRNRAKPQIPHPRTMAS